MESTAFGEQITPHDHVQQRIVEQSEYVVVPPIMEGISAVEPEAWWCLCEQIAPHGHVQERIVKQSVYEQSVYVVVPPIMEGISAVELEARIEVITQISQACQQSWEIREKSASTQELFQSWLFFFSVRSVLVLVFFLSEALNRTSAERSWAPGRKRQVKRPRSRRTGVSL